MTDKEKAIVMAYTGACMLIGDKFKIFLEYVENIMGRPVYPHEMVKKAVSDEIIEKAKVDFIALCAEQEPKTGWIPVSERLPEEKDYCLCCNKDGYITIGYLSVWSKQWCFEDDEVDIDVIAWMPLPEPYKAEK